MTQPYVVSEDGATRGLGWDINTSFSSNRGELFPLGSFGHTGFTGTSIWIDPTSQTFVVFMSNRVHPDGKGDVTLAACEGRDGRGICDRRQRRSRTGRKRRRDTTPLSPRRSLRLWRAKDSYQLPVISYQLFRRMRPSSTESTFSRRTVSRISKVNASLWLPTTPVGISPGKPTIDILHEAKNVKLVAIFAPEHGIRGELDTEKIDDTKDEKTGLPVFSLYKDGMRRPKPEQLKDLDAIVYDIQDIGARFYTYTATLKNVMEEAAKAKIPVYVLDRPNPINGAVEGPIAEEDKLSFIAAHTIPVRYGLTIGELGMLMNAERKIGADLRVIKMENWSRSMWFDETGQTWINPSPNMRSLNEATLYPGIGLLETTNVSVGRGTDTPFEVVGAPWLDGQKLAKYLNERNLKGVRFVPVRFKPNASVFKDQQLGGVNIIVVDRKGFEPVRTGIEIAAALRKLYSKEWEVDRYGRLLVNSEILDKLKSGESPDSILRSWRKSLDDFEKRRAPYLLYK